MIFSAHIMIHAEQLCDHVVMVHRGEKVIDDTIAGIRSRAGARRLLFEPIDTRAHVSVLAGVAGIQDVRRDGATWELSLKAGASAATTIQAVAAAVAPARIEVHRPTLEDAFVSIVTGDTAGGDAATLRAAVRDEDARAEVRS